MKTGFESVHSMMPVKLQTHTPIQPLPEPDRYSAVEPGINLYTHIATQVLAALIIRSDSIILTDQELVDKAFGITELLLRKLP